MDEAEIQGLLATDSFRRLVASWQALEAKPPEERRRRLVTLAFQAIEQALADWDLGAAFFVLREDARGRDPAVTVADGVIAASKRQARAGAAIPPPNVTARPAIPAPRPPSMAESGLQVIGRGAERLRAATFAEHAARHAAVAAVAEEEAAAPPPPSTGAATMAAARRALALKAAARRPVAAACPTRDHAGPTTGATTSVTPAAPIASLPRRPRAP